jgi:hypothetical protein
MFTAIVAIFGPTPRNCKNQYTTSALEAVNGGGKMYQVAVEKCTTLVNNIAPMLGACQVIYKA